MYSLLNLIHDGMCNKTKVEKKCIEIGRKSKVERDDCFDL